ncbi:tRNA-dihydrouridine(16/17) synthase [NAD(P)(+)] [Lachnellula occidentalis]|uniref:tRNA-dihydrouridine(16/17) synthase [NAD(P)(+)] n=1 Tax=Lachnellula occidentalis TaxID=215460 RepID=A0A8H8UJ52_9HELO|nr:tRNA-dihydrouridine(16/17) synthase [NAD(P)(+)] [Lachnellula occidentalis]
MTISHSEAASTADSNGVPAPVQKLHGRAFYESIGSPKFILAPMVDQSELAWRMLTRSFMPTSSPKDLLAYTPMLHARLFAQTPKFRYNHFQPLRTPLESSSPPPSPSPSSGPSPYLDGNPSLDRPLFVQFCANEPEELLEAARYVAPYCDAVDLNLGCPQGIARKGKYGAFLQEDQELIFALVNKLHLELSVPVTAKIRILDTRQKTLAYARKVVEAGASILTVHGRTREMKGHKTGLADWSVIKFLREQLPKDTVLFANGNVLQKADVERCLQETGVDGVMSAEGNLYDPAIFSTPPPIGDEGREYWRGKDGHGDGWRMDAVVRRYMDILYTHVLEIPVPERKPLYLPSDPVPDPVPAAEVEVETNANVAINGNNKRGAEGDGDKPPKKHKTREKREKTSNPNLLAMQPHLFHLLRPLVAKHHNVRDALARSRAGDIAAFENVLQLTELAVAEGLKQYEATGGASWEAELEGDERLRGKAEEGEDGEGMEESSVEAARRCKRPWWVVQAYVRPLPVEALKKGSLTMSKKDRAKLEAENHKLKLNGISKGKVQVEKLGSAGTEKVEVPKDGLVCG